MRILQIVNIGFEAGGAEKSVRLITDGLNARGHQVEVVATDLNADGQEIFADHLVPSVSGSAPRRFAGYLWNRTAYRQVRDIVDRFDPDCVHLHTHGEFSPAVLSATAGRPRLLTVHGPEDWTLQLLRWNLGSATARGGLSAGDRARYAYLRFVQRPAYLARLGGVDRILTPSRFFADSVAPDVGTSRTHILPNGIARTAMATPLTSADNVLFVGRLEHVKGVEVLLRAFEQVVTDHPSARLTVVGDGADRARLQAAHPDPRVTFTGWLNATEVAHQVALSSVVVLPSLWPENFPTVALEALQAGRPMIASRVGGLPELIGPDNGLLVAPGDPDALARALNLLLGNPEVLAGLGAGSAARAGRYDVAPFLDLLEHHYEEVCA
ncbi:glycosyltransferase family 4 protein [Actinoplanes sp. HUAS TT8]|uniref:glycosyltransferase family 4 protein n=1 Tax=Actinoplanes sp. HUAS TT8 TaxID=3447453 RepID=UPI003F51E25F